MRSLLLLKAFIWSDWASKMPYLPRFADYPTIGLRVLLHQGPSTQSLRFPQAPMVLGTPIWVLPSGSWPGQSCAWSPPEGGPAMAMSWALGSYRDKVALCEWAWVFIAMVVVLSLPGSYTAIHLGSPMVLGTPSWVQPSGSLKAMAWPVMHMEPSRRGSCHGYELGLWGPKGTTVLWERFNYYEGSVSLPETRPLCIATVAQAHGLASHAHGNELGL